MLIHHQGRDLNVTVLDDDATVADLARALDPTGGWSDPALWVEGRPLTRATPLDRASIPNGAEVSSSPPHRPSTPHLLPPGVHPELGSSLRLRFTTGADHGRCLSLTPGEQLIGRRPPSPSVRLTDPTVSAIHARLTQSPDHPDRLEVTDAGSTNGTVVDGRPLTSGAATTATEGSIIEFGRARAIVERSLESAPPAEVRTPVISRQRTGRTPAGPPPESVALPKPPEPPPAISPVGVVAMAASLLGAVVLVVVLGSWSYAVFAALGPLTMLAQNLDSRRRRRLGSRRARRQADRDRNALADALRTAAARERSRRQSYYFDPFTPDVRLDPVHPNCWERRLTHEDALAVRVGHGCARWIPPLSGDPAVIDDRTAALLAEFDQVPDTVVGVQLVPGRPLAIVGPAAAARGLVRTMVTALATAHGPADLAVAATWRDASDEWDWLGWLPHTHHETGCLLAGDSIEAASLTNRLINMYPTEPDGDAGPDLHRRPTLVVIDRASERDQPADRVQALLRYATRHGCGLIPVVILPAEAAVPVACTTTLEVRSDGSLTATTDLGISEPAMAAMTPRSVATARARQLSRFVDPELNQPGQALPTQVDLRALLGLDNARPETVAARWRAATDDPPPLATIGRSTDGPVVVNLAEDGPHLLIAGTTGSGKSELLRTLIMTLATSSSPDHLAFVLIDFKGGTAFDCFSSLPHTAGLISDLDDDLAQRALRCLEAELRHRESVLRQAGAIDLTDLRGQSGGPTLPRLVVVVDEFAALAASLPGFVDSLVDVAQRGRGLGVHLVLATQRPAGSVSAAIAANMAMRICLRVQSSQDSADVIGTPEAALLPRRLPGRALMRLGPAELTAVQVAVAADRPATDRAARPMLRIEPIGAPPSGVAEPAAEATGLRRGPGDLEDLIDLVSRAWQLSGGAPVRPVWTSPLPEVLTWPVDSARSPGVESEPGRALELTLGLLDDPDRQSQPGWRWHHERGPLLAMGMPGAGCATLAGTVALEADRTWERHPHQTHVIDAGSGELAALAGLPSVGAVVGGHEIERQRRLIRSLHAEMTVRQAAGTAASADHRLLVIHRVGDLQRRWEQYGESELWSELIELTSSGTASSIHVCLTAEGPVPHQLSGRIEQRVFFRPSDPADLVAYSIQPSALPELINDRGVIPDPTGVRVVQVSRPQLGLAAAVAERAGRSQPLLDPTTLAWVSTMPTVIRSADLPPDPSRGAGGSAGELLVDGSLRLVLGLRDRDLGPAILELAPAGHAAVVGAGRSGRTTCLIQIATAALSAGSRVAWVGIPPSVTGLPGDVEMFGLDDPALGDLLGVQDQIVVLVDNADLTDDHHQVLADLATRRTSHRHLVVAGRPDRLRRRYSHWTAEIRADASGVLLMPDPDIDGDLLGTRVPRRLPFRAQPGRGWMVDQAGSGSWVQIAVASDEPRLAAHSASLAPY